MLPVVHYYFCILAIFVIAIPSFSFARKRHTKGDSILTSGNAHVQDDLQYVHAYDKTTYIHVALSGRGYHTALINDRSSFTIQLKLSPLSRSQTSLSSINVSDAFMMVRLVSAKYIVGADVQRQRQQQQQQQQNGKYGESTFSVNYSIRDTAKYFLQIRITWLSGSGVTTAIFPLKNTSVDTFLNHSHYLDAVIYSKSVNLLSATGTDKAAGAGAAGIIMAEDNTKHGGPAKPLCVSKLASIPASSYTFSTSSSVITTEGKGKMNDGTTWVINER